MAAINLDSLDLAALLCSKVCHDVISPVGAIVNGLELLDEERDPDMRNEALKLVQRSAKTASAKLQFCRLAFGAAGSAGASIDTGDAEQVARSLLADDRTKLEWRAQRLLLPKNKVKLLLNMCLIGAACVPRGGLISVTIAGADEAVSLKVESSGPNLRLASSIPDLIRGEPESGTIDAHGIQAFYSGLVARACNMALTTAVTTESVVIEALPQVAASAIAAD